MKNDWTHILKKQLEGHEMLPPTGLWEGIDKQMEFTPFPTKHRKSITWWKWGSVAAVLLLVGFFMLYDFNQIITQELFTEEQGVSDSMEAPNEKIKEDKTTILQIAEKKQVPALTHLQADSIITIVDTLTYVDVYVEDSQSDAKDEEEDMPVIEEKKPIRKHELLATIPKINAKNKHERRLTISLNASIGFSGANKESDYWFSWGDATKPSYQDMQKKHHAPLRIGFKISYPLSYCFSLQSGITYSLFKSEIPEVGINQQLYYVGLPIGLRYTVWNNERFSLYGSVGMTLEKCIFNSIQTTEIVNTSVLKNNDKPWQWSLNAALGAEYYLNKTLGIYIEPSIGYYFNDGSSLEHYYKEHPLAPSLEIGLRWNM